MQQMTGSPETPVLATHNGFHAHVDFGVSSCLFHSRVRKFFDGAMRRPVQSVARGRTAIQSLICLGHVPSQCSCNKVLLISISFIAGFSLCFFWLLFGQSGDAEI